jgi:hypothetical protein
VEPHGLQVSFWAVAISGISTALFPSVEYTEQRGDTLNAIRKRPERPAFGKEEFHGGDLLLTCPDHFGITRLWPGKKI